MKLTKNARSTTLIPLLTSPPTYRIAPVSMEEAAKRLTQYLHLLASGELEAGDRAAEVLMQQAQQALLQSPEFQLLLAQAVPEPLRHEAQKRLMRQLYRCQTPDLLTSWIAQRLSNIVVSIQIDEALCALIKQIQALPKASRDRRNLIPVLLTQMQASGKITTHIKRLPKELYYDALHETFLWFCEHIDEYDPSKSSPVSWFNRNLFYTAMKILRSHTRTLPDRFIAVETAAIEQGGSDAYGSFAIEDDYQILDDLYDWVQEDRDGDLKRAALTDRLDINVQTIIIAVLNHIRTLRSLGQAPVQLYDIYSEQPTNLTQFFARLSVQLDYPPEKLRRFWRDQCRPCIEDFLRKEKKR